MNHTHHVRAGTLTDPVCGMDVDRSTVRDHVEHDGQTYFFGSSGCGTKFRENPSAISHVPRRNPPRRACCIRYSGCS